MLCKYVDRVASELMPFIEETLKIFNVEQEDDINGDAEIGNAWGVIMKKLKVMEEDIIWLFGEEEQVEALTTSSTVKEEAQITEQQQINGNSLFLASINAKKKRTGKSEKSFQTEFWFFFVGIYQQETFNFTKIFWR